MGAPQFLAAAAGVRADAAQVNQFLAGHGSQWLYAGGVLQAEQATGTGLYASLASGYLAQSITLGASQTAIGHVGLQISTVGGSPVTATVSPLQISLYAASQGLPTGPALASVQLAEPYVYSGPFWLTVPLYASGLTPGGLYCLTATGAGSSGAYYVWQHSNQPSGAATSPDGVTYAPQAFGLMWQVFDATATGLPITLVDDGGARTTTLSYTGGQLTGVSEYTLAQTGPALASNRTLTYTGGLLTGVA